MIQRKVNRLPIPKGDCLTLEEPLPSGYIYQKYRYDPEVLHIKNAFKSKRLFCNLGLLQKLLSEQDYCSLRLVTLELYVLSINLSYLAAIRDIRWQETIQNSATASTFSRVCSIFRIYT